MIHQCNTLLIRHADQRYLWPNYPIFLGSAMLRISSDSQGGIVHPTKFVGCPSTVLPLVPFKVIVTIYISWLLNLSLSHRARNRTRII
ncbi:hypothetical protein HOY82DRAFT_549083 [Tuber indicum]|nr:hypothetical protein HOY82DRAFT_549083 [Tuber indicum]